MSEKSYKRKLSQRLAAKNLPIINLSEIKKHSTTTQPQTAPASTSDERSPPLTSSPIGYTIRHSQPDLNRSNLSESFNVLQAPETFGDIDIRIFFPNGKAVQFNVEGGREATSSDILQLMADHLSISIDVVDDAFALWLISPLLEVQLKPHHVAYEVREKWDSILRKFTKAKEGDIIVDEPLLVMKRNVQLSIDNEIQYQNEDENLTEILYVCAKDEYMTGRYLVNIETAVELAALQMAIEFEPYEMNAMPGENDQDAIEYICSKITDLVPAQHVNTIRSFHLFGIPIMECKKGWENELVENYKIFSMQYKNNYQRRVAYLNILRATPFYGSAFFRGTTDRRSSLSLWELGRKLFTSLPSRMDVLIGINHEFVTVTDVNKHECLLVQRITDCSWMKIVPDLSVEDPQTSSFLLHFPDNKVLTTPSNKPPTTPTVSYSSENVHIHNGKTVPTEDRIVPPVSLLLQIFSEQSVMMEALLNALYELAVSEISSDLDEAQFSGDENIPVLEAPVPATLPTLSPSKSNQSILTLEYPNKKRTISNSSSSSKNQSLNYFVTHYHPYGANQKILENHFSNNLSRLCLATLDPQGRCVEAHGTLRRMLMEVH